MLVLLRRPRAIRLPRRERPRCRLRRRWGFIVWGPPRALPNLRTDALLADEAANPLAEPEWPSVCACVSALHGKPHSPKTRGDDARTDHASSPLVFALMRPMWALGVSLQDRGDHANDPTRSQSGHDSGHDAQSYPADDTKCGLLLFDFMDALKERAFDGSNLVGEAG